MYLFGIISADIFIYGQIYKSLTEDKIKCLKLWNGGITSPQLNAQYRNI